VPRTPSSTVPPIPEYATSSDSTPLSSAPPSAPAQRPSPFTPLALGPTEVHLLGQLIVQSRFTGTDVVQKVLQSFQSPDMGVSYVFEISIQPRKGSVKEGCDQRWGVGRVEVQGT
jgi:hypothetical protein